MTATECETDYVILVDETDGEIGVAEKLAAHEQNLLHRAFSIFIFRTSDRALLLQQRAATKYHSPSLWTNTCCSHPRPGESILSAGNRRLIEEMGITTPLHSLGSFHYNAHFTNGLAENEIDHVLVGAISADTPIHPNPEEVRQYRWISLDVLKKELSTHPEQFTPWLEKALAIVESP